MKSKHVYKNCNECSGNDAQANQTMWNRIRAVSVNEEEPIRVGFL